MFRFPEGQGDYFLLQRVRTGSLASPACFVFGIGGALAGVKRLKLEGDHLHPISADVTNEGAITPLPPISLMHS